LRRISVVVLLVLLMLVFAATAALAAPPDGKGVPRIGEGEEKHTGQPENPNGFGTVVSQKASYYHDVGEHSSSQEEPRLGVGNVARNDSNLPGGSKGSHPGDHGCVVGDLDDNVQADPDGKTDCEGNPGNPSR
jgi:hypothetical protein